MSISDEVKREVEEVAVSAVNELMDDAKIDSEEAIEILSTTLDALVPLHALLPGPLGELAENADDMVFDEVAKALYKAFTLDPDKIEMRAKRAKEKGNTKIAERRFRRAARVRKRQALRNSNSS